MTLDELVRQAAALGLAERHPRTDEGTVRLVDPDWPALPLVTVAPAPPGAGAVLATVAEHGTGPALRAALRDLADALETRAMLLRRFVGRDEAGRA